MANHTGPQCAKYFSLTQLSTFTGKIRKIQGAAASMTWTAVHHWTARKSWKDFIELDARTEAALVEAIENQCNDTIVSIVMFAQCEAIECLDLAVKHLTYLPHAIGRLSSLRRLELGWNNLRSLPGSIFYNMPALVHLSLTGNHQLTKIPPEIGNLTALETLKLGNNGKLVTEIPPEIGKLSALQELSLNGLNVKHFPPEIGRLGSLEVLMMQNFSISGSKITQIPSAILKLTTLVTLWLNGNCLKCLPTEIANLKRLEFLQLSNNHLKQIPPEIGQLISLETLHLSGNQLTDLPCELGNLHSLAFLELGGNKLTDFRFEAFPRLTKLDHLDANPLTHFSVGLVGNLRSLKRLELRNCRLVELPADMHKLSSLTYFSASNNQLTSLMPLGSMGSLKSINVLGNPLVLPPESYLHRGTSAVLDYLRVAFQRQQVYASLLSKSIQSSAVTSDQVLVALPKQIAVKSAQPV